MGWWAMGRLTGGYDGEYVECGRCHVDTKKEGIYKMMGSTYIARYWVGR